MNVHVTWDNPEHTIIRMTLQGRWQWHELRHAIRQYEALLDEVDYPVGMIAHISQSSWIPGDVKTNVAEIVRDVQPRAKQVIVVTPHSIFMELLYLVSGLIGGLGFRYRMAPTLEEARRLLNEVPAYAVKIGAAD